MAKEPVTPVRRSMVKSLMHFWQIMLAEAGMRCGVCTIRDAKTAADRFEHEGFSFLTITLPTFAKSLERSLALGRVDPSAFVGFEKRRPRGVPVFLQGLLDLVFDEEDGRLLDVPSVDAIDSLRQLTMLFGKLKVECTERRKRLAFAKYVETDDQVREADLARTESQKDDFRRIASLLFQPILNEVEKSIYRREIWPKHGPGKTADRIEGNFKFAQSTWTTRLEQIFPFEEYAQLGIKYPFLDEEGLDFVTWHGPDTEVPAQCTDVPKTLKAPRLIAKEPTCNQYLQGGLREAVVAGIEDNQILCQLIGFADQEPNRFAAEWGSVFGDLATLDLSDASDRVSNQHVYDLLFQHGLLWEAVQACRSWKVDVPGHGVLHVSKFASQGSSLTFPAEAMVFLTVIFVTIEKRLRGSGVIKRHLSMKDISSFVDRVRVYGDDIIVPTEYAVPVAEALEAYGLKVNFDKSFWTGKFRESCGGDYYDGEDVTPIRCKRIFPASLDNAEEIASIVALRNGLYRRGWWQSVMFLDDWIRGLTPFPIVEDTSPLEGRTSVCFGYQIQRTSRGTQAPLVKGLRLETVEPKSKLDGTPALVKFLLKRSKDPYGREHLKRYGRGTVRVKVSWSTPF
jgi:hypothetical protein